MSTVSALVALPVRFPINVVAVVVPDTFTFCRKVAFVFVLMLSVDATPVNSDPSPTNLVAVVTPVANISPSLLYVIPLPTTIPFLAVISPTESTLVTSS